MPLLLLPGLDGTSIFLEPLLAALPDWIEPRVVTYPASDDGRYEPLLPLALDAVADCSRFFVLGWSYGGPLALRVAAAAGDRVAGVILCATFVRAPRPWLRPLRFAACAPIVGLLRALWRSRFLVIGWPSAAYRDAKRRALVAVGSRAMAGRVRALLVEDSRERLRRLAMPVLCLQSARDVVVPPRNLAEIRALRPEVAVATLAGGHLALFTDAGTASARIAEFARRVPV